MWKFTFHEIEIVHRYRAPLQQLWASPRLLLSTCETLVSLMSERLSASPYAVRPNAPNASYARLRVAYAHLITSSLNSNQSIYDKPCVWFSGIV